MKKSTVALCSMVLGGCYTNSVTPFPEGLEPWEENAAALPSPVAGDVCPEEFVSERRGWMGARSLHARACIHAPIATVWRALRDPQTGRDPTTTHGFAVREYETEPDYDYSYRTYVFVDHELTDIEFELNWRHGVSEGTDSAPLVTGTRWQKTWGSDAISVMEGSLVLRPHPDDENITVCEYQYHLSSAGSNHDTIVNFLTVLWGRLRDRSHGETLVPNDCVGCAEPPANYL